MRRETGKRHEVKVLCGEGVANRIDPEGVVTLAKNRPFLVKFAPTSRALTC